TPAAQPGDEGYQADPGSWAKALSGIMASGGLSQGGSSGEAWEAALGGVARSGGLLPQESEDAGPVLSDADLRAMFGLDDGIVRGDAWITVKPHGPDEKGQPVKIDDEGKVEGGLGG